MMNNESIRIGKHTLESLTIGMYKDPLVIFREYIQNATDSIDRAIEIGLIDAKQAEISVNVDAKHKALFVRDNGTGIPSDQAFQVLCDIGNSEKDYQKSRGFRGIGRLGGLGYAEVLRFSTSFSGEPQRTEIVWDCTHLKELLQPGKHREKDLVRVIQDVVTMKKASEDADKHYFEVSLEGVRAEFEDILLNRQKVKEYLETVAPIPYNCQRFRQGKEIQNELENRGIQFEQYKVFLNNEGKPLHKPFTNRFQTGHQQRTKQTDYIKELEFFEDKEVGYFGWVAVTNFYGSVKDEAIRGIRLRKGNILIGDSTTFGQFFKSEKDVANSWFIGEVFIFASDVLPNARRDDFEKNDAFKLVCESLSKHAERFRKEYRRESSQFNSLVKRHEKLANELDTISSEISSGGITSDTKKEQLLEKLEKVEKDLDKNNREVKKLSSRSDLDDTRKTKLNSMQKTGQKLKEAVPVVENKIVNADYGTKNDLPTSYSKAERKIYQRIIAVIDEYFHDNPVTAKELRECIVEELEVKKKRK